MSTRVTFQFPTDSVVRYLEHVPRRGEPAFGLRGRRYVVSGTRRDPAGGHIVSCVTPEEYARDARRLDRAARVLAREMRNRAAHVKRRTLEVQKRLISK